MRWQYVLLVSFLQQAYVTETTDPGICNLRKDYFHKCGKGDETLCVPRVWICDGGNDCADGSDETFCNGCDPGWFECEIGHPCVPPRSLCNGISECPDGSDERTTRCGDCSADKFLCKSGECIPDSNVCDNVSHCFDNSDEHYSICPGSEIGAPTDPPCLNQVGFDCKEFPGRCIPTAWVCDGEKDCASGRDEGGHCRNDACTLHKDYFHMCGEGDSTRCIPRSWICDNANDCQDGSDETFCNGCDNNWFKCDIGHPCIVNRLVCDGTPDCPDGSDEHTLRCGGCQENHFQCTSGECLDDTVVCDGNLDCFDHSDEHVSKCPGSKIGIPTESPCNMTSQFDCQGHCIPRFWVCDKEEDCESGIDEDEEMCDDVADKQCEANKEHNHICGGGGRNHCIPRSFICDGDKDCDDGSDETFCQGCPSGYFKCQIGHPCVQENRVCNKQVDCPDGSDEYVSRCGACSADQFLCSSGECIQHDLVCDGSSNCYDNSDEHVSICPGSKIGAPTASPCSYANFVSCGIPPDECIPKKWFCDGEVDCHSGLDEGPICSTDGAFNQEIFLVQCVNTQFQCHDGVKCLDWKQHCDGTSDCHDNSDEIDCINPPSCPPKVQFSCSNKKCISWSSHCNGVDDCGDNSDEYNCQKSHNTWPQCKGMFQCTDDSCIPVDLICDRTHHCIDGSDEPSFCGVNECSPERPCSGGKVCHPLPTHHICVCPQGYETTDTGCQDINECEQHGSCSQYCLNTVGSYVCSCHTGFVLESDGKTCKAALGSSTRLLLYGNGHSVRLMDLSTYKYTELASNRLSIIPVAYHFRKNMAFFGDSQRNEIVRVPVNTKRVPVTILKARNGVEKTEGLAVDWINDWIYWSNTRSSTISMAKLDGTYHQVVVTSSKTHISLDKVRGVAVDPLVGYLFWSHWSHPAYIGRSAMDGSDAQHLIVNSEHVVLPNGIAVDVIAKDVYWVEAFNGMVMVASYDGRIKRTLIHGGLGHLLSIAVFEDKVYLSTQWGSGDHKVGKMFIASKSNGSHLATVDKNVHSIQGIAIYHSKLQPTGHNPCEMSLCSDKCVASYTSSTGYKCICKENIQLLNDEHTCEDSTEITRCDDSHCRQGGQCIIKKDSTKSCLYPRT